MKCNDCGKEKEIMVCEGCCYGAIMNWRKTERLKTLEEVEKNVDPEEILTNFRNKQAQTVGVGCECNDCRKAMKYAIDKLKQKLRQLQEKPLPDAVKDVLEGRTKKYIKLK